METVSPITMEETFPKKTAWGEIVWATRSPLTPDEVETHIILGTPQPKPPPEVTASIDQTWKKKQAADPGIWNGLILSLISVSKPNGKLILNVQPSDYRRLLGTHHNPEIVNKYPDRMAQTLVACSIPTTTDNQIVMGCRQPDGLVGVLGGTVNYDERDSSGNHFFNNSGFDLFRQINSELEEETGMLPSDMQKVDTRLLGLTTHASTLRPLLVFVSRLPLSSTELAAKFAATGKKDEHKGLIFIPNTSEDISKFNAGFQSNSTTAATVDALDVYQSYVLT